MSPILEGNKILLFFPISVDLIIFLNIMQIQILQINKVKPKKLSHMEHSYLIFYFSIPDVIHPPSLILTHVSKFTQHHNEGECLQPRSYAFSGKGTIVIKWYNYPYTNLCILNISN